MKKGLASQFAHLCLIPDWEENVTVVEVTNPFDIIVKDADALTPRTASLIVFVYGKSVLGYLTYLEYVALREQKLTKFHLKSSCSGTICLMPRKATWEPYALPSPTWCWFDPDWIRSDFELSYEAFINGMQQIAVYGTIDYYPYQPLVQLALGALNRLACPDFHTELIQLELKRIASFNVTCEEMALTALMESGAKMEMSFDPRPVDERAYFNRHYNFDDFMSILHAPTVYFDHIPLVELQPMHVGRPAWKDLFPFWIQNRVFNNFLRLPFRIKPQEYNNLWLDDAIKMWAQRKPRLLHNPQAGGGNKLTGNRFKTADAIGELFPRCFGDLHRRHSFMKHDERIAAVAFMYSAGFSREEIVFYFEEMHQRYPKGAQKLKTRFDVDYYIKKQDAKKNAVFCKNIWRNHGKADKVQCPFFNGVEDIENLAIARSCKSACARRSNFQGPHDLVVISVKKEEC